MRTPGLLPGIYPVSCTMILKIYHARGSKRCSLDSSSNIQNQSSRVSILTSTPGNSVAGGPFITLRNASPAHLPVSLIYKDCCGQQEDYSGLI